MRPSWVFACHKSSTITDIDSYRVDPLEGVHLLILGTSSTHSYVHLTKLGCVVVNNHRNLKITHYLANIDITPEIKTYLETKGAQSVDSDWINSKFDTEPREVPAANNVSPQTYLEGVSVFLGAGFDDQIKSFVRKVVREGGGNYMTKLDSFVTHFVVNGSTLSKPDSDLVKATNEMTDTTVTVVYTWLSECYRGKTRIDVEKYVVKTKGKENMYSGAGNSMKPKKSANAIINSTSTCSSWGVFRGYIFEISHFLPIEVIFHIEDRIRCSNQKLCRTGG